MSFRSVVSGTTQKLTPSEDRVLTVLLGEDMSAATAAEVAERSRTHESTVVRLARKLGYRGYPELRADLRRDEGTSTAAASLMRSQSGHRLQDFIRDEADAIVALPRFIDQAALDAAARTLHESRRVFLISSNDELPTLELLARRLRRLGLTVVTMTSSPKDLAERFVSFDRDCVLVAFALREAPALLSPLVAEVGRRSGRTILISDVPGYQFRPAPDHLLVARRGADDEYRTQLVPMVICYALQLAVHHLDPEHYLAVRQAVDDLTRMFGGTGEIPLRP